MASPAPTQSASENASISSPPRCHRNTHCARGLPAKHRPTRFTLSMTCGWRRRRIAASVSFLARRSRSATQSLLFPDRHLALLVTVGQRFILACTVLALFLEVRVLDASCGEWVCMFQSQTLCELPDMAPFLHPFDDSVQYPSIYRKVCVQFSCVLVPWLVVCRRQSNEHSSACRSVEVSPVHVHQCHDQALTARCAVPPEEEWRHSLDPASVLKSFATDCTRMLVFSGWPFSVSTQPVLIDAFPVSWKHKARARAHTP